MVATIKLVSDEQVAYPDPITAADLKNWYFN
jgi:hypothetical protein